MALSSQSTNSSASGSTGMLILYDFNVKETAGSTATVQLRDATAGGGNLKKEYNLAANESIEITWTNGIRNLDPSLFFFVNITAGAVKWNAGGTQEGGR